MREFGHAAGSAISRLDVHMHSNAWCRTRGEHFEIRSSSSGAGRDGKDGRRTGGVQRWVDGGRVSGAGYPQSCSTSGKSATFYCVTVPDTARNHDTRCKKIDSGCLLGDWAKLLSMTNPKTGYKAAVWSNQGYHGTVGPQVTACGTLYRAEYVSRHWWPESLRICGVARVGVGEGQHSGHNGTVLFQCNRSTRTPCDSL